MHVRWVLTTLFFLSSIVSNAQQEWGYSQYLFNLYDVNAAYAGNQQSSSIAARYRSQWMGMDGAPVSQHLSFHAPIWKEKLGIGMKILNESIGARKQQSAKASCAYKLHMDGGTFSFGLAGGVIRQAIERPKLTAADQQDVQLATIGAATIVPVIDASLFFNNKHFYAGVESTRLNKSVYKNEAGSLARLYYNMNLTAGVMKQVSEENLIQLSTLIKYSEGKVWQAELNLLYQIRNRIWFGGGYRYQTAYQIIASVNATTHLRFGFSYDIPTGQIKKYTDGSAEVFLGYNFKNRSGKSIRYF